MEHNQALAREWNGGSRKKCRRWLLTIKTKRFHARKIWSKTKTWGNTSAKFEEFIFFLLNHYFRISPDPCVGSSQLINKIINWSRRHNINCSGRDPDAYYQKLKGQLNDYDDRIRKQMKCVWRFSQKTKLSLYFHYVTNL